MCSQLFICNQMSHEGKASCCSDRVHDCHHLLCWILSQSFWKTVGWGFKPKLHLSKCILECCCDDDYSGVRWFLPEDDSWMNDRSLYLSDRCFDCVFVCRFYIGDIKTDSCWGENILIALKTLKQRITEIYSNIGSLKCV